MTNKLEKTIRVNMHRPNLFFLKNKLELTCIDYILFLKVKNLDQVKLKLMNYQVHLIF
jgi:hypothetical protein